MTRDLRPSTFETILSNVTQHIDYLRNEGVESLQIILPEHPAPDESVQVSESEPQIDIDPAEALYRLRLKIGDCVRCKLHKSRRNLVFGEGNPSPEIVMVGEGPGMEEDLRGKPFVGTAGQLLDRIIQAMGLKREDIYICNVVKCHPPQNRDPEPDEIDMCGRFLVEQLTILKPKIILCLGRISGRLLSGKPPATPLYSLRGQVFSFHGFDVCVTYHPSAVLREPGKYRRPVWEDVQAVMKRLGRPISRAHS